MGLSLVSLGHYDLQILWNNISLTEIIILICGTRKVGRSRNNT